MVTPLLLTELEQYLNDLLNCDALEIIHAHDAGPNVLYIPYMMNDALENYIILTDCQIIGDISETLTSDTVLELIEEDSTSRKNGLIFYKANGDVLTIWFSSPRRALCLYQYHRIGHFWIKGQEHWRRLVYIIGTLHEKYNYMGSLYCNDLELKLMNLMEFAPFRYWSPIHDSLDYFPTSENGLFFMHQFALEAGDTSYARWIRLYRRFPFKFMCRILAKMLVSEKREALYQLIDQKINRASERYAVRYYGKERNAEIEKIRTQFSKKLYADGFVGEYPHFHKNHIQLTAMEEHPFTISELEYENFGFRIRGMVTEDKRHYLYKNSQYIRSRT